MTLEVNKKSNKHIGPSASKTVHIWSKWNAILYNSKSEQPQFAAKCFSEIVVNERGSSASQNN